MDATKYSLKTIDAVLRWFPLNYFRILACKLGRPMTAYAGARILDPINSSTITVGGRFTNIALHEKNDIAKFQPDGSIVVIGSNFGEAVLDGFKMPEKKVKTTKRGRKPKPKEPKKRVQGSGKYFNSQITFIVRSTVTATKLYKFKVFRNGKFQVPGVLTKDLSDIDIPLTTLRDYFRKTFTRVDIDIIDKVVQMRNCKTIISDDNLSFNTGGLGALIEKRKTEDIKMNIYSAEYKTAQNSSKITVKFLRPTADNPLKTTTLKILRQKIDFEGAVGFDDISDIYWWLNDLIIMNYNICINDPLVVRVDDSDSSDTDAGESSDDEPSESRSLVADQKSNNYVTDPYDLG